MIHTMFLQCAYTNIPFIYRISTVVDSELIAEGQVLFTYLLGSGRSQAI